MKNISVYHNGNEITFKNTIWGREVIYYNDKEMSNRYSSFGLTHQILAKEDGEAVEYLIRTGMNGYGAVCNIWRNGAILLREFDYSYERALRKLNKKQRKEAFVNSPEPQPLYDENDFV